MLRDGTYLKGRAATGNEQVVRIAVGGSSDKNLRGREAEIPVSQVSTVYYRVRIGGNRFAAALGGALTGVFTGSDSWCLCILVLSSVSPRSPPRHKDAKESGEIMEPVRWVDPRG